MATAIHLQIGRSDHAVVTACFTSAAPHINQPTTRKVWRYSSANWGRLRHFFGTTDWSAVINDNPNHSGLNITQRIIMGEEKFNPSNILTTLLSDPHGGHKIMQAMAAKDKAWKACRNDINNNQLRQQSITAIKHAVRVFNQSRLAQEASVRARLSKGSMRGKDLWSCIKTAGGARKSSTIPLLVDSSGVEHASNTGKNRLPRLIFCHQMQSRPTRPPGRAASPTATAILVSFIHFPFSKVRRLLKRLNISKATGPDTISSRALKEYSKELVMPLARLFALGFHTGVQPGM